MELLRGDNTQWTHKKSGYSRYHNIHKKIKLCDLLIIILEQFGFKTTWHSVAPTKKAMINVSVCKVLFMLQQCQISMIWGMVWSKQTDIGNTTFITSVMVTYKAINHFVKLSHGSMNKFLSNSINCAYVCFLEKPSPTDIYRLTRLR